jgi:hypothetical protein
MFKFFFWCLTPAFAALPIVGAVYSEQVSPKVSSEELIGRFSLKGDSLKTPFILQFVFENCGEFKDRRGNALPFATLKLKYVKTQTSNWETIDLRSSKTGKNCIQNIEFYEDVQEKYNIELWASWDVRRATAGTFKGRIFFNILPKP